MTEHIEVRLMDEAGRTLTLTGLVRPGQKLSDVIDGVVLDQAEGRTTTLELEVRPTSAPEPRRG